MTDPGHSSHYLRKPLLILEFTALATLLGSMLWFGSSTPPGDVLAPAWLLIPAVASLLVFTSFIGLMYLRWVVTAGAERQNRHKLTFALLALTMSSVWLYGIVNTWISINAQ